jgi:hypothetical protein
VPSSTSSFERTVPGGRWGATWLVVAAVVATVVVRFELFVRSRGYQPSVKDDEYAWAWQRARVANDAPHTMALLGSSRVMLAFSPEAFHEVLPDWTFAQLGINGTTPIGALWDLARDESFVGVALVDMDAQAFFKVSWSAQDKAIETYRRRWRSVGAMAERALATSVQSHLALLATRGVQTFGKLWRTGSWPQPPYVTTHADRTRFADFTLADLARQRKDRADMLKTWESGIFDPNEWLSDALAIEPAVAAIQARGGQVVYVRMPTCDDRWVADELQTPRALFWDPLVPRTRATMIHFKDDPVLASFPCPDFSHIASKDGPAFTRRLLEILRERAVLAR